MRTQTDADSNLVKEGDGGDGGGGMRLDSKGVHEVLRKGEEEQRGRW